jgi:DNA polymerase III subunit gamma/tau
VGVLPFESKYKVYIVDEVHMLTKEAFNALLKTLEEPPEHAVFILATTEMEKLPDTVISRCQTFEFKKPNRAMLKDLVLDIAKKEGFKLDPSSADLVALMGDGSFRDTLGILQKVISFSEDKVKSVEEVETITGAPKNSLVNDFVEAVTIKEAEKGFKAISEASKKNIDMKIFLKLVLQKLRFAMLLRFGAGMEGEIRDQVSEEDFEFLKNLGQNKEASLSSQTLLEMLNAYDNVGKAHISELPLELALAKIVGQNGDDK